MKLKIGVLLLVIFFGSKNIAARENQIGLGMGLQGNGGTLFVPIQWNSFILEPSLSWEYSKNSKDSVIDPSRDLDEYKTWSIGVGGFYNKTISNKVKVYMGARVGYWIQALYYEFIRDDVNRNSFGNKNSLDGYFISPVLGLNYFFTPHLALGGELRVFHSRLNGEQINYNFGIEQMTAEEIKRESDLDLTQTQLILRFFF